MKIIDVKQESPEWLAWRKTVITGTDCPAILGCSPWVTPYKCWQRKLGLIPEQQSNEAMERGKRLEPEARAQFIQRRGIHMEPRVVESSEWDFLGASLDGICFSERYIIEIKCGGYKLHQMALDGIIPEYYLNQMQHQLLVTGAEKCFYYSYDGENGVCIEVLPDPDFQSKFLPIARAFWRNVVFFEPPPLLKNDYKDMTDCSDWNEYTKLYRETDASIKALEEQKDSLKRKLIELCKDENCIGNGLKIMKCTPKGRIAYEEIPEIKNINLDLYRKPGTSSWRITAG